MKVTTEELERCEVLMTVEIEPKKEQDLLKRAAKRIARQVRIPGFRPGKAPYNVVVRRFGMEAIQQEALEQSADKVIEDALKDAAVEPFAQLELESIDWAPLMIKVKIPTKPVIELGEYRQVRLEAPEVEVTVEDIQQALKNFQEQTATWTPVDRPAEIGDLISMAVVEKDGDEILAEHESVEHELDPPEKHEGHDHPDLTTPLIGLSAGDEKSFTQTYSESFGDERYAGKDITFEVEILSIKEKEAEALDDEFAKSVSDFETLDALKADIENNIREQRELQSNIELGNQALEEVIEQASVVWPLAFENERVQQEVERYGRQMEAYGLTMENFLQVQNKTEEEFLEETRVQVVDGLKHALVLGRVAELENLDVSETEILAQAKLIADQSGRGDELWRNILASQAQQSMIANDLMVEKTTRFLASIAKGEDPNVEIEEDSSETAAEEVLSHKNVSSTIDGEETDAAAAETTKTVTSEEKEEEPLEESATT